MIFHKRKMVIDNIWNRIDIIKDIIITELFFELITVFYLFNITIVGVRGIKILDGSFRNAGNIRWITRLKLLGFTLGKQAKARGVRKS